MILKHPAILAGMIVVIFLATGSMAIAHGSGQGYHRGSGCPYWNDKPCGKYGSQSDNTQLSRERDAFLNETADLRKRMNQKERELASELNKENPDNTVAKDIQKEISRLQADIDQKRVDHMIRMRKLVPNVGCAYKGKGYGGNCQRKSCW